MVRAIAIVLLLGSIGISSAVAETQSPTGAASLTEARLDGTVQLKFRDTNLGRVLEVIGKMSGLTINLPSELDYRVSFEIVDVSARRALEIVGDSQNLSYRQDGTTIWVEKRRASSR